MLPAFNWLFKEITGGPSLFPQHAHFKFQWLQVESAFQNHIQLWNLIIPPCSCFSKRKTVLFKFVIFSEVCSMHIIFLLILIWRSHLRKVTNKYSNFKFTNTKYFFIKANGFLSRQKLSGHPYTVLPAQLAACHSPVGLCLCFMLLWTFIKY